MPTDCARGCALSIKRLHEVPLSDVMRSATYIYYKRGSIPNIINNESGIYFEARIFDTADLKRGACNPFRPQRNKTYRLLASLEEFGTLDPKDHIFGLLGLYKTYAESRSYVIFWFPITKNLWLTF